MDDDVKRVHACRMIPSDIINQILYRLPSKSVGRFRCVSKDWLSLLTQPDFIKTHRITLNRNHHIFYDYDTSTRCYALYSHPFHHHNPYIVNPTKLPIEFTDANITFLGSCDGLVLVSFDNTLGLLNPTTREYVQLPQFPGYYPYHVYVLNPITREFERWMKPAYLLEINQEYVYINSTYGIGYDSVTDDYKVITLTYFEYHICEGHLRNRITSSTIRLSIYSLRSNTWRQQIVDSLNYDCRCSAPPVYMNGFLHWVGKKKGTDGPQVIVAFSLVDECFREVPSPDLCNDTKIMSCNYSKPIVLGGKLAVYPEGEWSYTKFELWFMNEYGVKESWAKIALDIIDNDFPLENYMIFDDNGKIRVASNGQMWIYDFEKRHFTEEVYVWSKRFRLFGSYDESLVSPKRNDKVDAQQIFDSSTKRQNAGSKDGENHKILNDKKASLRKKKHEEQKAKGKNKRKKFKKIQKIHLGSGGRK